VYIYASMTKIRFNFWLDPEQKTGLTLVKDRDGIHESEQVRRAIDTWLESKGVTKPVRARKTSKSAKRKP
jgi:hypothetical protein